MHKTLITASAIATFAIAAPALALPITPRMHAEGEARVASTTIQARQEARAEAKAERMGEREAKAKERAASEIDRRIAKLNELGDKVKDMARVSDGGKDSVSTMVQAQIAALNDLRAKIQADDSTTTLKADMQSITKSYRVFALVIPQGHINVSADKIHTTASMMTAVTTKLSTRLADAASAGSDVAALQTTLTGVAAKLADANAAADAAVALTAGLSPDNGDQALMTSNKAALKAAREKIQTALKSIQSAREDIHAVADGLKKLHVGASATTSASTSEQH